MGGGSIAVKEVPGYSSLRPRGWCLKVKPGHPDDVGNKRIVVYLLYISVPIVMRIPSERGFLFASAMVAVGLVGFAALLAVTVILWEMGAMPVFTD